MTTCLESLSFVTISNINKGTASLTLEAGESDKDGEFRQKNHFFHFRHLYAMEVAHQAQLFAVMDSPCA